LIPNLNFPLSLFEKVEGEQQRPGDEREGWKVGGERKLLRLEPIAINLIGCNNNDSRSERLLVREVKVNITLDLKAVRVYSKFGGKDDRW